MYVYYMLTAYKLDGYEKQLTLKNIGVNNVHFSE